MRDRHLIMPLCDDMLTILQGDALLKLRELPDESVQCCVTSPPYWGLRDYGTAEWEGGDPACPHRDWKQVRGSDPNFKQSTNNNGEGGVSFANSCPLCGATRVDSQLGLEKTPEEYVAKMVEIFREVWRVLRKDGTLWLNLGDSYCSTAPGTINEAERIAGAGNEARAILRPKTPAGLKPKDLIGIPWRVAFALQADGWWLRSDIIWNKPNPMPESVTDRPTKSHEYLFLLTKNSRYYYDNEAIKERASDSYNNDSRWLTGPTEENEKQGYEEAGAQNPKSVHSVFLKARKPAGWATHEGAHGTIHRDGREQEVSYNNIPLTCNKRSVWTVTTQPYPEAHFATYPPDLIKPCILAGTKPGDAVLDPFAGSGTTGQVALELGRKAILIELNPKYVELIETRCTTTIGLPLC